METEIAECIGAIDKQIASVFLDLAKTYHNYADNLFKTFITVLFSSFAFASGFPMSKIGRSISILNKNLSIPSLAVGVVLMSFYAISYFTFSNSINSAAAAANELVNLYKDCPSGLALQSVLPSTQHDWLKLNLPKVGYIIGSTMGVFVFIWLANTPRTKD